MSLTTPTNLAGAQPTITLMTGTKTPKTWMVRFTYCFSLSIDVVATTPPLPSYHAPSHSFKIVLKLHKLFRNGFKLFFLHTSKYFSYFVAVLFRITCTKCRAPWIQDLGGSFYKLPGKMSLRVKVSLCPTTTIFCVWACVWWTCVPVHATQNKLRWHHRRGTRQRTVEYIWWWVCACVSVGVFVC